MIRNKGPWRGIDDVKVAVVEYIDWYNHRRLHARTRPRPTRRVRNQPSTHHHRPTHHRAGRRTLHQSRYLTTCVYLAI
ncbi:IS3 family transposase [Nonomuraea lactucae]|uniref:IS3 family transposase n=1 Tax=Nonomuraea lactucae TaxID=2249762 RepID=UPI000DE31FDD